MSNLNSLIWTDAYIGRLETKDIKTDFKIKNTAKEISTRLETELNEGKLPFISMPYMDKLLKEIKLLEPKLKKFKHMLLLGIGGSALGARALQKAFFKQQDLPNHQAPWLWIADNVDAENLNDLLTKLDPKETIVVTISKSGETIETLAQYFIIKKWLKEAIPNYWSEHFIIITDAKNGFLRKEADEQNIYSLPVPKNLGGRYSVLSAVGLVPAAFMRIDYNSLMQGATAVFQPLLEKNIDISNHQAWNLAIWATSLMNNNYSQLVFFSYIPCFASFGQWFAQLWAESLGKEGKGSMPIPAVGVTDQHSLQQMFLDGPKDKGCIFLETKQPPLGEIFPINLPKKWAYLQNKHFGELLNAEALGTKMALYNASVPTLNIKLEQANPKNAGKLMALLELSTVLTGWLLKINPIDQPAVELGKILANAKLGAPGLEDQKTELKIYETGTEKIEHF